MPLGIQIGLGPGDFVLDGDPTPPRKKGTAPSQFSAHAMYFHGMGLCKVSNSSSDLQGHSSRSWLMRPFDRSHMISY